MKTIEVNTLTKMFLGGAKNLEAKKEWINELNVFPVPDGDTGTNMTLTIMSAASEVNNLSERTMETVAKAISSGSLRGAARKLQALSCPSCSVASPRESRGMRPWT